MKTLTLMGICALFLSAPAFAGKPQPPQEPPPQPPTQTQQQHAQGGDAVGIGIGKGGNAEGGHAVSGSQSRSNARADSDSHSVAKNKTVVDASSDVAVDIETGDTLVETGDMTIEEGAITVEGDEGDTHTYDFPSNTSYAPPSFSNIRCGEVFGAGYTNTSGSGSLGIPVPRWMSRKIRDCEADADAVWLAEMGLRVAAIEARCGTKSMQDRFGGKMKGREKRATACKTHLLGLARDEAELAGLRDANRYLSDENVKLRQELETADEQVDRCTKSWTECQSK